LISSKFIKSSFIYTFAGALPMASGIILLPLYVAYLPANVYGALSICLAISTFIQVIVTYSFDTSVFIHYHEFKHDKERLSFFVSSVFIFIIGLGIIVSFFCFIAGGVLYKTLFPHSTISFYPYGYISVGIGLAQAILKVYGNLLQSREQPLSFFWLNIVSFAVITATTVLGLEYFPGTLIGPMGGRLLAGGLAAAWVLFRVFKQYGIHIRSPWQQTSSSFNAFTFAYQFQVWAINYLDRFLMAFFLPLSTVGIYDFAMKCVSPIELILNGLNASVNPKIVSELVQQKEKHSTPEINRYFYGLISIILLMVCVTIAGVPLGLDLFVSNSDYASSLKYIPFLALLYIFKATRLYFVVPFTALKRVRTLTTVSFIVMVIKVILMIVLMYYWKLFGLILSSFIAYFLEHVLLRYNLKKYYTMHFNFFKLVFVPLLLFATILILEWQFGDAYPLLLHIFYGLLCVALLGLAYRNELKLVYSSNRK
jgi:O-antigen/teichoic acid export membrane protein